MKPYYIIFNENNLTYDPAIDRWVSEVIDLYDNEFYTNYSATRSKYGLNALGDSTWTGLTGNDIQTEVGYVDGDRFVDTSGAITISQVNAIYDGLPDSAGVESFIDIYTTDDTYAFFPDEYASLLDVHVSRDPNMSATGQFGRFAFKVVSDVAAFDFQFVVTVLIDEPLVSALHAYTRKVLNSFPEWMELREDSQAQATPSLARPNTVAGHLVNAISGEWLEYLSDQLSIQAYEQHIETLDATIPSVAYRSVDAPEYFVSVMGDGVELTRASNRFEFFAAREDPKVALVEGPHDGVVSYTKYTTFTIDGVSHEQVEVPIWNVFDDFGLLVDLKRLQGEGNERFRSRILDVYRNKPGVSVGSFQTAVRRELDLWAEFDVPITATPVDGVEQATPRLVEISGLELDSQYFEEDGLPTEKALNFIEEICKSYPTTWGHFLWGEGFWDTGILNAVPNYKVLPHRYDAELPSMIQPGVGDLDDLLITRPTNNVNEDSVELTFTARGFRKVPKTISPLVIANAEIWAEADRKVFDNETLTYNFVVRIEPEDTPSEYLYLNFQMSSESDIDWESATPNGYGTDVFAFVDDYYGAGFLGGEIIDGDGNILEMNEDNIVRRPLLSAAWMTGHWDPDTDTVINKPLANNFEALFSGDIVAGTLTKDTVWRPMPLSADPDEPGKFYLTGYATFQSTESSYTIGRWQSETSPIAITLNGAYPGETDRSFTVPIPQVIWSPFLESPPNKTYEVQLLDQNEDGDYGINTTDANGDPLFLPASYLNLNGSNTWVDGKMSIDETDEELVFFVESDVLYPVTDAYEVEQFTGTHSVTFANLAELRQYVTDDFSPHRSQGDSFFLGSLEITKAQLGAANTEDDVITWLGVSSNNEQVDVWLESNIVVPLSDDYPTPDTAGNRIEEELDAGTYKLTNISPFMRVKPGANKFWNPQMHTGWIYIDGKEQYAYHSPKTEVFSTESATLNTYPQQGAPIIVKHNDVTYRQVAFHNDSANLGIENSELHQGDGRDFIYVGYEDIRDISVQNKTTGTEWTVAGTETADNRVDLATPTDPSHLYEVSYTPNNSFYLDHDSVTGLGSQIVFDKATPDIEVTYETAHLAQATPIDVPLHPFYTSMSEGYIYVCKDVFGLFHTQVTISPQSLVAGEEDYALIVIKSYDSYGNPKPNIDYIITTSFGFITTPNVTTDDDGYAYTIITAEDANDMEGVIYVALDDGSPPFAEVPFTISHPVKRTHSIHAIPSHEAVPADGNNNVVVHGIVYDENMEPVPDAIIRYRTGRTISQALNIDSGSLEVVVDENLDLDDSYLKWPDSGKIFTRHDPPGVGTFTIGPFEAQDDNDPGRFFVVVESRKTEVDISDGNSLRGYDAEMEWPIVGKGLAMAMPVTTYFNSNATCVSNRIKIVISRDCNYIRPLFINWSATGANDSQPIKVRWSIDQEANMATSNNSVRLGHFYGEDTNRDIVIMPDEEVVGAPLYGPFTAGDTIFINTRTVPTGTSRIPALTGNQSASRAQSGHHMRIQTSGTSDFTINPVGITNAPFYIGNTSYGPVAVLGNIDKDENQDSWLILGDDVSTQVTDSPSGGDDYGYLGWDQRSSLGKGRGILNLSSYGATISDFLSDANRVRVIERGNCAIIAFGQYDIDGSIPLATIQANIDSLCDELFAAGVRKIYGCTVVPSTSSSDGWATTANQTPNRPNTPNNANVIYDQYNTWIKTVPGNFCGYIDFQAAVAEDKGGGVMVWKPNFTDDGIGPNRAGIIAMADAVTTELALDDDDSQSWDLVGDVTSWYEYPEIMLGIEEASGLPKRPNDLAFSEADFEPAPKAFPVSYYEGYSEPATPDLYGDLYETLLPSWFPLSKYDQYQLGMLGDMATPSIKSPRPDYKAI